MEEQLELLRRGADDFSDETLEKLVTSSTEGPVEELLKKGVSCLCRLIQDYFLGPSNLRIDYCAASYTDDFESWASNSSPTMRRLQWCLLALSSPRLHQELPSSAWWLLRALSILQTLLTEPSLALKKKCLEAMDYFESTALFARLDGRLMIQYRLEAVQVYLAYFQFEKATESLEKALKLGGISVELVGQLGKRTKFQQNDIAQLMVKVAAGDREKSVADDVQHPELLPRNCALNSEVLLDSVKTASFDETEFCWSPIEHALLLGVFCLGRKVSPRDSVAAEKGSAFVDALLSRPSNYAVQYRALYERCILEQGSVKRVERALSQSEQLSADFSREKPTFSSRFPLFFAAKPPPIWDVLKLQASILRKLGCVREALRIYEQLNDWENTVDCYKSLGRLEQAEKMVRDLLDQCRDTEPKKFTLLCLLGDITRNGKYYRQAWDESDERFARAAKGMARLMLANGQLSDSLEWFRSSLNIFPLDYSSWYNLGYVSMELEEFDTAASAYHQCSRLEPDSFEAWNNLAAAHLHKNQMEKAFAILKEAIKYDYDNWKVWENYLATATDLREVSEAIRAYHRLIDLKSRRDNFRADEDVLEKLSFAVKQLDSSNELGRKLRELFGRLTGVGTVGPRVWAAYAALYEHDDVAVLTEREKRSSLLQKAYQAQRRNMGSCHADCCLLCEYGLKLFRSQLSMRDLLSDETRKFQLASSIRIAATSLKKELTKKLEQLGEAVDEDRQGELCRFCTQLDQIIELTQT